MSELINKLISRKEVLFLFSFFFINLSAYNSQNSIQTYLCDIDTIQLNDYQLKIYSKNGNVKIIKSFKGNIHLNLNGIKDIDSLNILNYENSTNYKVNQYNIKLHENKLFLSPNHELEELIIVGNNKDDFEVGILNKSRFKNIASSDFQWLIEIPRDSSLINKKLISLNYYPVSAKSPISKEKLKKEYTQIKPIIFQCQNVNCTQNEKIMDLQNISFTISSEEKNKVKIDLSDANLFIENENLYIGFEIISKKAAFRIVKSTKSEYPCYLNNKSKKKYSKWHTCPKISITLR